MLTRTSLTITFRGELDFSTVGMVAAELSAAAERGLLVIVDLSKVEFMDCATVGAIAAARNRARRRGGELILSSPRGVVRRLLILLDFPFRDDSTRGLL